MKNCLNQLLTVVWLVVVGPSLHSSMLKSSLFVQTTQHNKRENRPLISTLVSHTNLEMKPFILEQYLHSGPIVTIDVHLLFCVVSIGRAKTEGHENLYPVHKTAGRSNSHLNGAFQFRATTGLFFQEPREWRSDAVCVVLFFSCFFFFF